MALLGFGNNSAIMAHAQAAELETVLTIYIQRLRRLPFGPVKICPGG